MPDYKDLVARYRRRREVGLKLASAIVETIPKQGLLECARKLGIAGRDNLFVFESTDETAVLMDYCIFNIRKDGRNLVEQYLADSPPPPDSEEMELLHSMVKARYSMWLVDESIPGVGVKMLDILTEEPIFVVDIGLSQTAEPGIGLASRVVPFEDHYTTAGAALPFARDAAEEALGEIDDLFHIRPFQMDRLSPEQRSEAEAIIIRACREAGAADHIAYQDLAGPGRAISAPPPSIEFDRVGRNDPCPCGSGKKFKKCCGKS